jgi:hypothetical protein
VLLDRCEQSNGESTRNDSAETHSGLDARTFEGRHWVIAIEHDQLAEA